MYTEEMLESIKKVEASRTSRIGKELRRMDADEKDNLLKEFHPDYKAKKALAFTSCCKRTVSAK